LGNIYDKLKNLKMFRKFGPQGYDFPDRKKVRLFQNKFAADKSNKSIKYVNRL